MDRTSFRTPARLILLGASLFFVACDESTGPDDKDPLATPGPASPVAVGVSHVCGIAADGKVYCWGNNSYGLLGNGATDAVPHPSPEAVVTGVQFASIGSQGGFTCGLTVAGQVYCWGVDRGGSLGSTGTQACTGEIGNQPCSTVPIPIPSPQIWSSVAVMWSHACALTATGAAFCWGNNSRGQAGTIISGTNSTPRPISSSTLFKSLSGGDQHTCGISHDKKTYCWGDNRTGQLGLGTTDAVIRSTPTPVNTNLEFTSISGHGQDGGHTCGIATDGKTYCWGLNTSGQLGIGSMTTVALPTPVATSVNFAVVAAGYNWSCALSVAGKAYCWGASVSGSIPSASQSCTGTGGAFPCSTVPVAIEPSLTFNAIRVGSGSACGVVLDGRVYCWGANDTGKLGNGTVQSSSAPVVVGGGRLFPVPAI